MPWIVPSHQAPVLPLKLWKPRLFSGLALCIGAAAPDLEFILRVDYNWIVSHTVLAQLFFTVPFVLLLHAIVTSLMIPWALPLLPSRAPWHLHDLGVLRPAVSTRECLRVGFSGLIGGLSHVFLDGFTHGNQTGWAATLFPILRTGVPFPVTRMPLHDVLQVLLTIVFGAFTLLAFADIGRRRLLLTWAGATPAPLREASPNERRRALQYMIFCAILGLGAGLARRNDALGPWIEIAAHGVLAFLFYGVLLAAATDRLRSRRPPTIAATVE
jgi:hypothetical protein